MVVLLPGWVAVAPYLGAEMVYNPFPQGTVFYFLWSNMWDELRPWAKSRI